ncbi:MAG: hypothetical protein VX764_07645 [Planctomycetota bacterium]|nr:hypothetical protein [Planctomycetota bacterium]
MQQHHRVRPVYCAMAAVWITLVVVSGCAVPGYNEREAMLFEDKLHTEFKVASFSPKSSHFSGGSGVGVRMSYEYEYGMHYGFEITSIEDVEGAPYSGPGALSSPDAIRDIGEQSLSRSDRRSFTINFDWDVPISQDGSLPYFRYGFGVGGLYSKNSLNQGFLDAVEAGSPGTFVEVTDQLMFLFSPSASIRWDLAGDSLTFIAEAQYDIASHDLIIDLNSDGDIAGEVDYGGLGAYVGIDYSF